MNGAGGEPVTGRRRLLVAIAGLCAGFRVRLSRAARPAAAFEAADVGAAMDALFGNAPRIASGRIAIDIDPYIDNGAIVPIEIAVDAPAVRSISIVAADNPVPLVARFEFADGLEPVLGTRIKLAQTTRVIVVADTGDQLLMNERAVEVGIGGCA